MTGKTLKSSYLATDYLLVIGNSGAMLALAARDAGYQPLVIDLYGDQDTCRFAEDIQCVPTLAPKDLFSAISRFIEQYQVKDAVYAAGLECFPDSLKFIAAHFNILGNGVEVFLALQNKAAFFQKLLALEIPYPEVAFEPPEQNKNWLYKPFHHFGGTGITWANQAKIPKKMGYWQKYQTGIPHSVLFLADGKQAQVIGFNRQWVVALSQEEFIFSGIINTTCLTTKQKTKLLTWVNQVVAAYHLRGLNSMDFIQDGEKSYVLEINPRPPASMQLYQSDLFVRHVKACCGELPADQDKQQVVKGYQIVYAHQPCQIADYFEWPEGAMDFPQPGAKINTGQPICSIIAHGTTAEAVHQLLTDKQDFIIHQLGGY